MYQLLQIESPLNEAMKLYNISEGSPLERMQKANDEYILKLRNKVMDLLKDSKKLNPENVGCPLVEDALDELRIVKKTIENNEKLADAYKLQVSIG